MLDKRWPPEHFAEIADRLAARGIHTVLTGGSGDIETCSQVAGLTSTPMTNLAGSLDLMATTAVIESAAVYVGGDTGMSHLAAAVGSPAVVIFGPTNPERYAPRGERVEILALEDSRSLPDLDLRKPNAAADRPSTSLVTVDDVDRAIERVISSHA